MNRIVFNPSITRFDERLYSVLVDKVVLYILKLWRRLKLIERQVELHVATLIHQVVQEEELDITLESLKQLEK